LVEAIAAHRNYKYELLHKLEKKENQAILTRDCVVFMSIMHNNDAA
jgi:hypothetical protein